MARFPVQDLNQSTTTVRNENKEKDNQHMRNNRLVVAALVGAFLFVCL
jgi:hypothetical protein